MFRSEQETNNSNSLTNSVLTSGHHFDKSTSNIWSSHNSMFVEKLIFVCASKHVTTTDKLALFKSL
jgi:hypothetical protein